MITRAPSDSAISRVLSWLPESTTMISSAHSTERIASAMFRSSFKVMITAEIFTVKIVRGKSENQKTDESLGS